MITMHSKLQKLFPVGTKVVNLDTIEAYVKGYVTHTDGSVSLLLHEKRPDGTFKRFHWAANPKLCKRI